MIYRIQNVFIESLSLQYARLFEAFYTTFYKAPYLGERVPYRYPDYAFGLFEGEPSEGDTVLDVGCACSYFVNCLACFASKVYGIDLIESYARKWSIPWLESMDDFEDYRSQKIEIVQANAATLPFPDNFFDKIYTFSALEHFEGTDDASCASHVGRTLKPGGVFVGTVDYNEATEMPWPDKPDYRVYTYESFVSRVLEPSGLSLAGEDLVAAIVPAAHVEYKASTLFFKLVKR